jgi:hypothetical protein
MAVTYGYMLRAVCTHPDARAVGGEGSETAVSARRVGAHSFPNKQDIAPAIGGPERG